MIALYNEKSIIHIEILYHKKILKKSLPQVSLILKAHQENYVVQMLYKKSKKQVVEWYELFFQCMEAMLTVMR